MKAIGCGGSGLIFSPDAFGDAEGFVAGVAVANGADLEGGKFERTGGLELVPDSGDGVSVEVSCGLVVVGELGKREFGGR